MYSVSRPDDVDIESLVQLYIKPNPDYSGLAESLENFTSLNQRSLISCTKFVKDITKLTRPRGAFCWRLYETATRKND